MTSNDAGNAVTTTQRAATQPGTRHRRRRLAITVCAAIVLAAAIAVPTTLLHLDHQYGPIEGGGFAGAYKGLGFVAHKDGFGFDLAPGPATRGKIIGSLFNAGSHSVTVTSVERGDVITDVRWSRYVTAGTDNGDGRNTPWHAFPATVPPKTVVRILVTIRHPAFCKNVPRRQLGGNSSFQFGGSVRVHWQSLLASHTTTVDMHLGNFAIGLC